MIRVMCEIIDNKMAGKRFDMQTRHLGDIQNCRKNRDPQTQLNEGNVV